MPVNEQLVITYNQSNERKTRVYATCYSEEQAVEGVKACAERHGSLHTNIRSAFAEDTWDALGGQDYA